MTSIEAILVTLLQTLSFKITLENTIQKFSKCPKLSKETFAAEFQNF